MYIWVKPRLGTHTKMWAEVSSSAPNLLHKGLLVSPIQWRWLLRILCPVRRPMTTQDCVMLKYKNLVFVVGLGPEISVWGCLWLLLRLHHITKCSLSTRFIILLCSADRPTRTAQVQQTSEKNRLLRACLCFHFPIPQNIQGPSTVPLRAR
jgi:hypothetical protein